VVSLQLSVTPFGNAGTYRESACKRSIFPLKPTIGITGHVHNHLAMVRERLVWRSCGRIRSIAHRPLIYRQNINPCPPLNSSGVPGIAFLLRQLQLTLDLGAPLSFCELRFIYTMHAGCQWMLHASLVNVHARRLMQCALSIKRRGDGMGNPQLAIMAFF